MSNNSGQAAVESSRWRGEPAVRFRAGGYEALLIPGIGAQIIELKELKRGLTLLRSPERVELEEFKARPQIYGLPILFPPNRLDAGKFPVGDRVLTLPLNSATGQEHLHGYLRLRAWEIAATAAQGDEARVEAVFEGNGAADPEPYDWYLSQFRFRLNYTLSGAGLRQELTVTNRGQGTLPLGVGFHTALRVPFHPEGRAEDCRLRVSVGEEWELTERGLPTGKRLPLNGTDQMYRSQGVLPQGSRIAGHYTDQALIIGNRPFHGALIEDRSKGLRLVYEVGPEYRHWMIWNDAGDQGFICAEPQTWAVNAPNLKLPPEVTGYRELRPEQAWTAESSIYVEEL
jgi:aldose 1-epimerase